MIRRDFSVTLRRRFVSSKMPMIHASASVSPQAVLGAGVRIGPGCVLEGAVTLGDNVEVIANAYLRGPLTIGPGTVIFPGVWLGFSAQHLKVKPSDPTAGVRIGAGCTLRENATVHAATKIDVPTIIGDACYLMVNAHVGHDCRVGSNVTMVNNTALAGHAEIADQVTLGGGAMVHQFTRVGRLAMIGGGAKIVADAPPFSLVVERAYLSGINVVGLRRAGVERQQITRVREACRRAFKQPLTRPEMQQILDELAGASPLVAEMAAFIRGGQRPISVGYRLTGATVDQDEPASRER
jgi:UDP-N-acetylglucosamine acyltransferase